ncbi:MAG TPA: hypothetical protein VFF06_10020 [Polyangia bacterium]|nr:hypothetical protein [Polyangia bacterium]
MAENLTWQQVRDGARDGDAGALVAQMRGWFEWLPLWQWASLAHAELKQAIEERARALGKPFTVDHAIRVLGEIGDEAHALRDWLEGQSFAGAARLRAAVEAHLEQHAGAAATPATAKEPPREEPKKEEAKPKEEAKAEPKKDEAKAEPKKEEAKPKDEAKAEPKKEEAKAESKKDEPKKDEAKAEPKKDEAKADAPKA